MKEPNLVSSVWNSGLWAYDDDILAYLFTWRSVLGLEFAWQLLVFPQLIHNEGKEPYVLTKDKANMGGTRSLGYIRWEQEKCPRMDL